MKLLLYHIEQDRINRISTLNTGQGFYKNSLLSPTAIQNSESIETFKEKFLNFIETISEEYIQLWNIHKFQNSFQESINLLFNDGSDKIETICYYLVLCSNYVSVLQDNVSNLVRILLFGKTSFSNNKNALILNVAMDYVILT